MKHCLQSFQMTPQSITSAFHNARIIILFMFCLCFMFKQLHRIPLTLILGIQLHSKQYKNPLSQPHIKTWPVGIGESPSWTAEVKIKGRFRFSLWQSSLSNVTLWLSRMSHSVVFVCNVQTLAHSLAFSLLSIQWLASFYGKMCECLWHVSTCKLVDCANQYLEM